MLKHRGIVKILRLISILLSVFILICSYQVKDKLPIQLPNIPEITFTINNVSLSLPKISISLPSISVSASDFLHNYSMQKQPQENQAGNYPMEWGNEIYSQNAILLDLDSGNVIGKKASRAKIYPASLTKIMTAIVAIEQISDLNKENVINQSVFDKLSNSGASMAGFLPGEKVKAIDLLYGAMLSSGADAAEALALFAADSQESFIALMNQKAKELKMDNTNFTNASGLHHINQYSTAEDLAKLLRYALKNKIFYEVFTSSVYSTSSTNLHSGGLFFTNSIFKYLNITGQNNNLISGAKTGYTKEAGLCLASLAQKGEKHYILITAAANGNLKTQQYNITDAINIYTKYLQ